MKNPLAMTQGNLGTSECGGWCSGLVKGVEQETQQRFAGVNLRLGRDLGAAKSLSVAELVDQGFSGISGHSILLIR